jgi:hypothetical protein
MSPRRNRKDFVPERVGMLTRHLEPHSKKKDLPPHSDSQAPVNEGETEHFLKDVLGTKKQTAVQNKTSSFIGGFIIGFVLLCISTFFVYTTIYYVKHELLQSTSSTCNGQ